MIVAYLNSKNSHARRHDFLVMQADCLLDELDHELNLYQQGSTLDDISLIVSHLIFVGQLLCDYE